MTPAIRSTNPFYPMLFTTPFPSAFNEHSVLRNCVEKNLACHCFEVLQYFGTFLDRRFGKDLDDLDIDYIERIQNTVGNFIRTADPNNWNGNPRPHQDIVQINSWRDSQMFNVFGVYGQYPENYRSEYCDKLDEMWEYMLH